MNPNQSTRSVADAKTTSGKTKDSASVVDRAGNSPTIAQWMTPAPHSVGKAQTLDTAHAMMRAHTVRHLPVLEGGRLVGIVSQRDLYLVETLQGVDPASVTVEDAMSPETYCVKADTQLDEVAKVMVQHKYGCAIVMDRAKVVGLFTTIDAMRALMHLLGAAK